jgi:putative toxin-antitoxin system antitoxin component (TIGR02293 family)
LASLVWTEDAFKFHQKVLDGLPIGTIRLFSSAFGLHEDDLAKRCGIPRASYRRHLAKKSGYRLGESESDTLARYLALFHQATEVFEGDVEATRSWLSTSQPGLGGAVPMDFARTTVGYREVEKLLTRIDLGVYA